MKSTISSETPTTSTSQGANEVFSAVQQSPAAVPLLPEDLAEPAALVAAIRARRGGTLLKLDRMLLHSPALAEGWNQYLGAVRSQLAVPIRLRELAMCAVAVLNRAHYEYEHHAPIFIAEGGSAEQAHELLRLQAADFDWGLFPEVDALALRLSVCMTRDIEVPAEIKQKLAALLGHQQLVELVAVVATYNMVSRFLVALEINSEHHPEHRQITR